MAHTGLSKRVVNRRGYRRSSAQAGKRIADKVFETTHADADAGPTAIAHGWTLEEPVFPQKVGLTKKEEKHGSNR